MTKLCANFTILELSLAVSDTHRVMYRYPCIFSAMSLSTIAVTSFIVDPKEGLLKAVCSQLMKNNCLFFIHLLFHVVNCKLIFAC
jgi:hypothetical protein